MGCRSRQTAAQLDSFANSERRGENGGFGIRDRRGRSPAGLGAATRASEPAAADRPASPPVQSAPRSPPPAPSARTHALANFSPLPSSPSPSSPLAPSPSFPNPATSAAAATHAARRGERPARLRAHTHTSSSLRAPSPAQHPLRRPQSPGRVRLRSAPTPRAAKKLSYGPPPPTTLRADAAAAASSRAAWAPGPAAPGSASPAPGARSPVLRPLARTPQTLTGDELPLGQVLRVALFAAGHCPGIYSGIARRAALMRGAGEGV